MLTLILKEPVACAALNLLQLEGLVCHLKDENFEDILMEYYY